MAPIESCFVEFYMNFVLFSPIISCIGWTTWTNIDSFLHISSTFLIDGIKSKPSNLICERIFLKSIPFHSIHISLHSDVRSSSFTRGSMLITSYESCTTGWKEIFNTPTMSLFYEMGMGWSGWESCSVII